MQIYNKKQEVFVRTELKKLGFIETPAVKIQGENRPWIKEIYPDYTGGYTFFSLISQGGGEYPQKIYLAGVKAMYGFYCEHSSFDLARVGILLDPEKVGKIKFFLPCEVEKIKNKYKEETLSSCGEYPRHCTYSMCKYINKNSALNFVSEKAKTGCQLSKDEDNVLFNGFAEKELVLLK